MIRPQIGISATEPEQRLTERNQPTENELKPSNREKQAIEAKGGLEGEII